MNNTRIKNVNKKKIKSKTKDFFLSPGLLIIFLQYYFFNFNTIMLLVSKSFFIIIMSPIFMSFIELCTHLLSMSAKYF